MQCVLGIDTGGTYTDTVVLALHNGEVLYTSKRLTSHEDLGICIKDSLRNLPEALRKSLRSVHLSTTLATNAAVENRGGRAALVFIGERPSGKLPVRRHVLLRGKIDILGRVAEPVHIEEVLQAAEDLRGEVDAVAVSGFASVRNPSHELLVRKLISETLHIPVVCAHEISSSLGFYHRSCTAALNASLIPPVTRLIHAVERSMKALGIEAPLMIVKSDGSLMSASCAVRRPIDTILSGPAASAIGALYLSKAPDGLAIDIGGTTTDTAQLSGGALRLFESGARIGDWTTCVKAASVYTAGVGGDSRICLDHEGHVRIQPERCIPFCRAASEHPELLEELPERAAAPSLRFQDHEAYLARTAPASGSPEEKQLLEVLQVPHTAHRLFRLLGGARLPVLLEDMVRRGLLTRIALTPTDLLHITGEFTRWNAEASRLAAGVMAAAAGISEAEFLARAKDCVVRRIDQAIFSAAMYFDQALAEQENLTYFIDKLFWERSSEFLQADYRLRKKIIAIGAPAKSWLTLAGEALSAEVLVPPHAEAANAVGAAAAVASENLEILIRPDAVSGRYLVFSPLGRRDCGTLEEATEQAAADGRAFLTGLLGQAELSRSIQDVSVPDVSVQAGMFVERRVHMSARAAEGPLFSR